MYGWWIYVFVISINIYVNYFGGMITIYSHGEETRMLFLLRLHINRNRSNRGALILSFYEHNYKILVSRRTLITSMINAYR